MKLASMTAAAALLFCTSARAEPVGPLVHEDARGATADVAPYASFGLDGAFGTTLGAAMGIRALGARANVATFFDATWMLGSADFDDFRLRAGIRANALRHGPFRVQLALLPEYSQTSNASFTARSLGTELRVAPGFDAGRWSGELQASLDQQWLTYFEMTDTYRTQVNAGARDGWYSVSSTVWRVGLRGAVRFGSLEVSIAAGWEHTGALDVLPPIYANLSLAYTFSSPKGPPRGPAILRP